MGDVCREGLSGALTVGAAAVPCIRVELCRKMRILLAFFTTHVSFLGGQREVKRGIAAPNKPGEGPRAAAPSLASLSLRQGSP